MLASVKEFFNQQQREEHLSQQKLLKNKTRRTLGIMPTIEFDIPDITEFTHYLECDISPSICPMQWEELDIDFDNNDRRFCEYCDKYIYKVDNEYMLKEHNQNNECIAISNDLLEKINDKIEQERYNKLQDRLHLSKLYLVVKKYESYFWQEIQKDELSQENILKKTIKMILEQDDIDFYLQKGVDMQFIFEQIVSKIKDDEFVNFIKNSLNNKT